MYKYIFFVVLGILIYLLSNVKDGFWSCSKSTGKCTETTINPYSGKSRRCAAEDVPYRDNIQIIFDDKITCENTCSQLGTYRRPTGRRMNWKCNINTGTCTQTLEDLRTENVYKNIGVCVNECSILPCHANQTLEDCNKQDDCIYDNKRGCIKNDN